MKTVPLPSARKVYRQCALTDCRRLFRVSEASRKVWCDECTKKYALTLDHANRTRSLPFEL